MSAISSSVYIALFCFCLIGFARSQSQRVTLYDNRDSTGGFINLGASYAADLTSYGFNNRARSVCVTGIWLFYDLTHYNGNTNAAMEYVYGNNHCTNLQGLGGAVTSVRYAGVPNDYRVASITLFTGTYFQGEEEYTTASLPNLSLVGRIKSVLVTGSPSDGWTLYDRPNYIGNAVCVFPPQSTNFEPGLVTDTLDIGVPHGTVQSVRRGCFGKKIMRVQSKSKALGTVSQQGYHQM